jgi:hypothetical protein
VSTGSQGQTATDTRRQQQKQVHGKHDGEWSYGATPVADDESECWADVYDNVRRVHSQLDSRQTCRQRHNAATRTRAIRPSRERPCVYTSRESVASKGPERVLFGVKHMSAWRQRDSPDPTVHEPFAPRRAARIDCQQL